MWIRMYELWYDTEDMGKYEAMYLILGLYINVQITYENDRIYMYDSVYLCCMSICRSVHNRSMKTAYSGHVQNNQAR